MPAPDEPEAGDGATRDFQQTQGCNSTQLVLSLTEASGVQHELEDDDQAYYIRMFCAEGAVAAYGDGIGPKDVYFTDPGEWRQTVTSAVDVRALTDLDVRISNAVLARYTDSSCQTDQRAAPSPTR